MNGWMDEWMGGWEKKDSQYPEDKDIFKEVVKFHKSLIGGY